jgi:aminoglycoside 3-N-acetyltransferase I
MEYLVQRLDATNIELMKQLNKLFGDVFEDTKTYNDKIPSDKYLESFLQNTDNIVLVAMSGDQVIGGLVAYTLTKFEMERKEIYIYDLGVKPDYQKQGIGRSLIEQLKTVSRALGAYVIFVQADEADEAVKFYESLNPSKNIRTRNFDYLI